LHEVRDKRKQLPRVWAGEILAVEEIKDASIENGVDRIFTTASVGC
jgi:hypothetical protein